MTNRDKTPAKRQDAKDGRGDIATAEADCVANPPTQEKHQRFSRYTGEPNKDVDAMAEDSFPASDPPSYSGSTCGTPNEKRSSTTPKRAKRARRPAEAAR